VITEWISWRWTILVNVPVGVLVLAAMAALVPAIGGRRGRVDVAGALSASAALTVAVYATVTANDAGWASARTLSLYAAAVVLLGAFLAVESRRSEPLVRLGIFRTPNLSAANGAMALLGAAWIPMWFFLNLYLQRVRAYDAFEGGLALLPMTVAIMILMVGFTGRLVARVGFKPPLLAGLALLAAGIGLLARLPADGSFLVDVLPASLVAAVGMSLAYIPLLMAALANAAPEEAGLASGLVNTTYQVGSALGLTAMTALATAVTGTGTGTEALTDGFRAAFAGAAAIALVAVVGAALAIRRPRAEAVGLPEPAPLREAA
jgi:MFS family permease